MDRVGVAFRASLPPKFPTFVTLSYTVTTYSTLPSAPFSYLLLRTAICQHYTEGREIGSGSSICCHTVARSSSPAILPCLISRNLYGDTDPSASVLEDYAYYFPDVTIQDSSG